MKYARTRRDYILTGRPAESLRKDAPPFAHTLARSNWQSQGFRVNQDQVRYRKHTQGANAQLNQNVWVLSNVMCALKQALSWLFQVKDACS